MCSLCSVQKLGLLLWLYRLQLTTAFFLLSLLEEGGGESKGWRRAIGGGGAEEGSSRQTGQKEIWRRGTTPQLRSERRGSRRKRISSRVKGEETGESIKGGRR